LWRDPSFTSVTAGVGLSVPAFLYLAKKPVIKRAPLLSLTQSSVSILHLFLSTAMKIYKQETVQHVNASLEECWAFFSNPKNLQKITPEGMGFQITDFDKKSMYAGQIIQYKVTPLLGITLSWMTEITYVKENSYFIDEQRFGPYSFWHHKHFFEATPNGTKMTDVVHYGLPLGFLGRIMNTLVVKNKLKSIFAYRVTKVDEMFNAK
jgi:ligand-binding SRPBCC domain-containing protein